jgi:hypothetical protein
MSKQNLVTALSPPPASPSAALSPIITRLADIPEEEIWLGKSGPSGGWVAFSACRDGPIKLRFR